MNNNLSNIGITEVQNIHTRDLLKILLGVVSSSLDASFVLIHDHTWHNPNSLIRTSFKTF